MKIRRYTGPHFGNFLNSALSVAVDTLARNDLDEEGPLQFLSSSVTSRQAVSHEEPPVIRESLILPDLVLIGNGTHTFPVDETVQPRDSQHWNFTVLHHRQIQVTSSSIL